MRAEMPAMVTAREFEKAANLQEGQKDLVKRLAAAEQEWIDGLQRG